MEQAILATVELERATGLARFWLMSVDKRLPECTVSYFMLDKLVVRVCNAPNISRNLLLS
jgi:hypothetical protein